MHTIKDILKKFNPLEDRYLSREFQSFGVYISEKLEDTRRKSLYIKLAKTLPRPVLEQALRFVVDSRARNKGALFMWKLKQLNQFNRPKSVKSAPIKSGSVKSVKNEKY